MQDPTGRYASAETAFFRRADGSSVAYLRRRIIPSADTAGLGQTTTRQGERLDTLANRALGDPLGFWLLCDANIVLDPMELTRESGRLIFVPLARP